MTLSSLVERLEKATGADRELDVEIWLAVTDGSYRKKWNYTHSATGRVCEMDETRDKFGHLVLVPAYSESTDAAMSLVPEGWIIESMSDEASGRVGELKITGCAVELTNGLNTVQAICATRPNAISAAALKARMSCEESAQ